ncbi:DUF2235 domain-containing protein [Silvanigrella aquatica]|uniref:Uncharacterized protein n=1 Tax=Silvanigrella aquatica TaxID=1915309 RepID=A0A1L4D2V3_9BACT|nr:DUF2235 domain-containing protein [Silvanigrella aquatica]APJ04524.1 hypothetical protein AXG55_11635 [Silvanigrella aquatica]
MIDNKYITYFFDGTGSNLNSKQEIEIGKSVVGELYEFNKSNSLVINSQGVILKENKEYRCVKIYFPGPGADPGEYDGIPYPTPGRSNFDSLFLNGYKSYYVNTLNKLFGNGWEHNEAKALSCAAQLSYSKKDNHIIIGYSRGAITAISFSKKLSKLRPGNRIFLFLIDPVAGSDYSKIKNHPNFRDHFIRNNKINPFKIGENVYHAKIFYACNEKRILFKPQLPLLDNIQYYDRPLYFSKNTEAEIYFMYADHRQIAYRYYKNMGINHGAGHKVYNQIAHCINKIPFYCSDNSNFIFYNEVNLKTDSIYQYQDRYTDKDRISKLSNRIIANEVSRKEKWVTKKYAPGELFRLSNLLNSKNFNVMSCLKCI